MAKILFAFNADIYVRNYLRSGLIDGLQQTHNVSVIGNQAISLSKELSEIPGFLGFYKIAAQEERKYSFAFNLMMWRNRKKSRTFVYRWMRNSKWTDVDQQGGALRFLISFSRWLTYSLVNPRWIVIPLAASRLLFPVTFRATLRGLKPVLSLEKVVRSERWDAIVFPSAAFDPMSVELIRLGKQEKITTLCLIDNWDNLTSKTVFWSKPDHLGVWGPQSRTHALEIHEFSSNSVHLIGTPRFDQYFSLRNTKLISPYPYRYILFVGAAMPFDEISTLFQIDKILEGLGPDFKDLRVVYRPHPWQQKRKTDSQFVPERLPKFNLDLQIAEAPPAGIHPRGSTDWFQPDLDYYPALLSNAECVVGPLTTMLLEASLCLRPVVALSYSDGSHFNPADGYFTHFDGIESIPGFTVCKNTNALRKNLENALKTSAISPEESDAATGYFLHQPRPDYRTNLASLISAISAPQKPTFSPPF